MKKKLIGFSTTLQEHIEAFATEKNMNFSEAVRFLSEKGLGLHITSDTPTEEGDSIDLITVWKEVQKLQTDTGWFKADDTQSRLGNAELEIKELKKKVLVLLAASKLFKKHIEGDDGQTDTTSDT